MAPNFLTEKASWTLVYQGVVSVGNFQLNVLLASTLSAKGYREFRLFLGASFMPRAVGYSATFYPLLVRLYVANDEERAVLLENTVVLSAPLRVVLVAVMAI